MKKVFFKFWYFITRKNQIIQENQEKSYLKNFSNNVFTLKHEVMTPEKFVNTVNSEMCKNCSNFKKFKLQDVKVFNVFSSDNNEFLHSVYALVKPYGIFYITIGTRKVLFNFTEDITEKFHKADTFRIYTPAQKSNPNCSVFYKCKLKNGIVKVYAIFKEYLNSDGNFEEEPYENIYGVKFPVKYDDLLL